MTTSSAAASELARSKGLRAGTLSLRSRSEIRTLAALPLLGLALLVLPLVVRGAAFAEGAWSARKIAQKDLRDVTFVSPSLGWAVGNDGTVLSTPDGGATWASKTSGTTAHLNGVDFVDEQRGWAVGAADTVLRTTNGGQTWTRLTVGTVLTTFYDVDFVDPTHGWAVGNGFFNNVILATTDGGQTWTRQLAAVGGVGLQAVSFADRQHGFAVGSWDLSYRTQDGGLTWVPMPAHVDNLEDGSVGSFYAARHMSPTVGLLAGSRGRIYRTDTGGLTWTTVAQLPGRVNGLAVSGDEAVAAADDGAVARSLDGGRTWETQSAGTSSDLQGVSSPAVGTAFAVGLGGVLASFRQTPPEAIPLEVAPFGQSCDGADLAPLHGAAGTPVLATALDLDDDADEELIVAGSEGIRALDPLRPIEQATLWEIPFQTTFRDLRPAELDGDPGPEVVASVSFSSASRTGILAIEAETGRVMWSRRVPTGGMLRTADLTGDGVDDLVLAGLDKALRILSGLDGAELRSPLVLGTTVNDLDVADLTGDGVEDVVLALLDGRALALDGANGSVRWTYRATDGVLNAVALRDLTGDGVPDAVVGGSGVPASLLPQKGDGQSTIGTRNGSLVALLDGRNGAVRWDYGQPGQLEVGAVTTAGLTGDGTPDVVAHVSRFAAGHLLALDGKGRRVAGAETPESYPLWVFSTTRGGGAFQGVYRPGNLATAEANGDGVPDAFVATRNGGVFAVSGRPPAQDSDPVQAMPAGQPLWEKLRPGPAWYLSLVRAGGRLLVLSLTDDSLVALRDASTGEQVWAYDGGEYPVAAPGELDGDPGSELIVGTRAGRVYSLDGDGAPFAPGADVFLPTEVVGVASRQIAGGDNHLVIVASHDGTVRAMDPLTLTTAWETRLETETSSLAAGPDAVAVGTEDGRVIGLDPDSGILRWEVEAGGEVSALAYSRRSGLFGAGDDSGQVLIVGPGGGVLGVGSTGTASQGGVNAVAPADLDGDGREEFAAAAGYDFFGFRQNGARMWTRPTAYFATQLAAGDLDGDGADDVLGGSLDNEAHAIDGPTGNLHWTAANGYPGGLGIADLDGDGAKEALIGRLNINVPARLLVTSAGGARMADCAPAKVPQAIFPGDLDGDGTLEAMVVTRQGDVQRLDLA